MSRRSSLEQFGENKELRRLSVTPVGWKGTVAKVQTLGYSSVSAYLEAFGRDNVCVTESVAVVDLDVRSPDAPDVINRYRKYIPERLQERYRESLLDPDILAHWQEIALIDARISDLLKLVDSGESRHLWDILRDLVSETESVLRSGDASGLVTLVREIISVVKKGAGDRDAWAEILALIGQRNQLATSERRRLVEMRQYISNKDINRIITGLLESVQRNVKDSATKAAIAREFSHLTADLDS